MKTSKMEVQDTQKTGTERHTDIDWLRVLGMLTVFLFHCARFFDEAHWHVKNNQLTFGMSVFVGVVSQWMMPLFFVLSGFSTYYSLSYRRGREYIAARVKRLVIPFIFGTFAHIPLQVYFERVSHSQFAGSFLAFYPHYFDGWYGFGGNFAWMGLHLWYLEVLFVFSLIMLPLFLYLRQERIDHFVSRLVASFRKPGVLFTLAVPIAIMELLVNLQPEGIGRRDFGGWSLLTYLIFFILAYLIAFDSQLKLSIERHRIIGLAMGVVTTISGFFLLESGVSSRAYYFAFLRAFNSWFWLVAILGFGSKYLNANHRVLKYTNEAVLPFYILHQTVILTIGFYIVSWDASVTVKFLTISTASMAAIMIFYNFVIKRINPLRFLFGMKLRTRSEK